VVQLSKQWYQPMIREIAKLPITAAQNSLFRGNRPLADQDANMACHMESLTRYVASLNRTESKLVAKERVIASAGARSSSSSDPPQPTITIDPAFTAKKTVRHFS
jgi:hypothetical protein